mmetsp:Transcript_12205/g.33890  ORF Transcript_12205/g.33890 Transcript_12205/m.33890 type:complete len:504 (-) Transcript_12205:17-1528(-)
MRSLIDRLGVARACVFVCRWSRALHPGRHLVTDRGVRPLLPLSHLLDHEGRDADESEDADDDLRSSRHGRGGSFLLLLLLRIHAVSLAWPAPPAGVAPSSAVPWLAEIELHDNRKVVGHHGRVVAVEDLDLGDEARQARGQEHVVDLAVLPGPVDDVVAVLVPPVRVPLLVGEVLHGVDEVRLAVRLLAPQDGEDAGPRLAVLHVLVLVREVVDVAKHDDLVALGDGLLDGGPCNLGLPLPLGTAVGILWESLEMQAVEGDGHAIYLKVRHVVLAEGRPLPRGAVPALASFYRVLVLAGQAVQGLRRRVLGEEGHVLLRRRVDSFPQQRRVLRDVGPLDHFPQYVTVFHLHQVQDIRVHELDVLGHLADVFLSSLLRPAVFHPRARRLPRMPRRIRRIILPVEQPLGIQRSYLQPRQAVTLIPRLHHVAVKALPHGGRGARTTRLTKEARRVHEQQEPNVYVTPTNNHATFTRRTNHLFHLLRSGWNGMEWNGMEGFALALTL